MKCKICEGELVPRDGNTCAKCFEKVKEIHREGRREREKEILEIIPKVFKEMRELKHSDYNYSNNWIKDFFDNYFQKLEQEIKRK